MSSHTGVIAILTTRKNTTQLLKPKKTVKLWALALQKHGGCGWRRRTPSIRPSGRRSLDCWMSRREVAEAKEEDRRLMHHFEAVEPPETWYVLLVLPIRLYYVRMHSGHHAWFIHTNAHVKSDLLGSSEVNCDTPLLWFHDLLALQRVAFCQRYTVSMFASKFKSYLILTGFQTTICSPKL